MNHFRITLVTAFLAVVSCITTYRPDVPESRTWPATGITKFNAVTQSGAVTATAWTDSTITAVITRSYETTSKGDADAHFNDIVATDTVIGGELTLKVDMPSDVKCKYGCDLMVRAPAVTKLNLQTTSGAVSVAGIQNDVTVNTTNGAVGVTNVTGTIDLHTTNGAVTLTGTDGRTTAVTTNGRVTAAPHRGSIDAQSSNGAIDIDLARFDTTDSAILHTSNGGVTVSLPADASFSFDALTSSGNVEIDGFTATFSLNEASHKTGTVGTGKSILNIVTSAGKITVRPR